VAPFCVVAAAAGAAAVAELAAAAGAAGVEVSAVAAWLWANADGPNAADNAISAQSIFLMADAKVLCFMISLHSCQ
jgi:hypothetical protein